MLCKVAMLQSTPDVLKVAHSILKVGACKWKFPTTINFRIS